MTLAASPPGPPIAILDLFGFTPEEAAFDYGCPALRRALRRAGLKREALARAGLVIAIGPDHDPLQAAAEIRRALGLGGPVLCLAGATDEEICDLAAACLRAGQAEAMIAGGPASGEDAAGLALFKTLARAIAEGDRVLGLLEPEQIVPRTRPARPETLGVARLWPLQGRDLPALVEALEGLEAELDGGADLDRAHRARIAAWRPARHAPSAALLGATRAEVLAESRALRRALAADLPPARWTGPTGGAFSLAPLGPEAQIAFIHAGGLEEEIFWGWRLTAPFAAHRRRGMALMDGLKLSGALADLLQEGLGLSPALEFGHGIGEIGMLAAAGVWGPPQGPTADMGAALRGSELIATGLSGRKALARRYFHAEDAAEDEIWGAARLTVDADKALRAAAKREDVFVTLAQSPRSVVVAGDPGALEEFAREIGAESFAPDPDSARLILHCDLARMGFSEAAAIFRRATSAPKRGGIHLSARDFRPIRDWSPAGLSWALAETLCAPADFRRLAETAHRMGARIFVECGPGSGAAAHVSATLKGRAHLAVALQQPGVAPERAFWSAMARLLAEGLRLDATRLASGPLAPPKPFGPPLASLFDIDEEPPEISARDAAAGRRVARRLWSSAMADALEAHERFMELHTALRLEAEQNQSEAPRFGAQAEAWMRKWTAEGAS